MHNDNNSQQDWQKLQSVFVVKGHTNTHQMTHTILYEAALKPFSIHNLLIPFIIIFL